MFEQNHVCETTPGVTPYSGYINLPSTSSAQSSLSSSTNYSISLFYWYFPARSSYDSYSETSAPLVLWLGGGPGQSSIYGATEENGPCYVNADANSTTLNPWSFNNHANVLYIESPPDVGYSYSELVEGVLDQTSLTFVPMANQDPGFTPNITAIPGRLSNPDPLLTANTTDTQARMLWNALQLWIREFPFYDSGANGDKINVWGNSVYHILVPD